MAGPVQQYPVGFASGGVRGDVHPFALGGTAFQRATNVRLHRRMARTAHGWECVPVDASDFGVLTRWKESNTQGAWVFNPGLGQSAMRFADEQSQILHAAGGSLYRLLPSTVNGRFTLLLQEADGGLKSSRFQMLAWGAAGESWFIKTTGTGNTLFLDGRTGRTRWSNGYSITNKDGSEIPNRAGPIAYLHGRMHVGVRMNGMNGIVVGDPVHRTDYSGPDNLLQTTEQVYLNTGLFLAPPSSMGSIMGIAVLPLQDTQHGHGEMVAFCPSPGGTWTADTNVYPRSDWGTRVISKHAILNTAAAGPFSYCEVDGDIVFRSRKGMQSLRSARAERNTAASPFRDLAGPVRWAMKHDFEELLVFNSTVRNERTQRLFTTVHNFWRGLHRWHRGFLVACQDPEQGVDAGAFSLGAWEGLRCLPPEAGGPVQFVAGNFNGREELFAICWNHRDRRNSVWRLRADREYDSLESGERRMIDSRIVTGQFGGSMFQAPDGDHLYLLAENIIGDLTWQVSWRHPGGEWTVLKTRKEEAGTGVLTDGPRFVERFPPADPGRRVEFLVRWRGAASVMLMFGAKPSPSLTDNMKGGTDCECPFAVIDDDYEYNNGDDWTLTPE